MLASAVAGIASSGVAYADLSGQITQIKAQVSALSSAQTTLSSTVSTLSTSSTCLISKVCFHTFLQLASKTRYAGHFARLPV